MRVIRAAQRSEPDLVTEAAECVRTGGTLVFPTDTVYGIGCDPCSNEAIGNIFEVKGRTADKPLALHIANISQALSYVADLTECARSAMERLWPGPVAIIVRRRAGTYERAACGFPTISLRCPDHDLCRALLRRAGPLAATSANASGSAPFTGDESELHTLPEATLTILAGPTPLRKESTIIDCTGSVPWIVREGAMPAAHVMDKLGTPGGLQSVD